MKKAVLYLRYSSAAQSEQSIEGQRAVCRKFADAEDYQIIGEYVDRATSASHDTQKRVSFLKMISDAQRGKFDAVIVYKLDRFARNRYDAASFKYKLRQAGVKLISATERISDAPEGVLMESLLEGMAEYYSLELAQKVNRGISQSIEKLHWLGGPLPFGFRVVNKKLEPDPIEGPLLRRCFFMVLEGSSYGQIRRYLAGKGVKITQTRLHRALHSKRAVGYYCYKDIEIPGAMDPIVDLETFTKVQERLKMIGKTHHNKSADYLLSGKIFCGHCGSLMAGEKGRSKNGKYHFYYTCQGRKKGHGCQKARARKEDMENFVVEKARAMLTDEMIDKICAMVMDEYRKSQKNSDPVADLRRQIREIELQIENGLNAILSGFHNSALNDKLDQLQKDKDLLSDRIDEIEASRMLLDPDMIKFYLYRIKSGVEDSKIQRKRLIQTFIDKVIVWDEGENKNRKIQIIFNLSNSSATYECSTGVANASPFETQANTIKVSLDQMIVIAQYTTDWE